MLTHSHISDEMFSRIARAFSRARVTHVSRLLKLSGSKVMYRGTSVPALAAFRVGRSRPGMIVSTLFHCFSCNAGERSPTSTSRLELTNSSRATCSARSMYRLIQYIERESRTAAARHIWPGAG